AALHDIAAVGLVADPEQRIAAGEFAMFGADRQHAQRLPSQQAQGRDALQQGNIVFDRHGGPVMLTADARYESIKTNRITAPACSHRLPSPESPGWRRLSRSSGAAGRCGFPACGW